MGLYDDILAGKATPTPGLYDDIINPKKSLFQRADDVISGIAGKNEAPEDVINKEGVAAEKLKEDAKQARIAAYQAANPIGGTADRYMKSIAAGFITPFSQPAEWIGRHTGIKPLEELGQAGSEFAENITPPDQTFGEKLAGGAASTASYFIPGTGVAKLGSLAARGLGAGMTAARGIGSTVGAAVASGAETLGEAQQTYEEALKNTGDEARAETQGMKDALAQLPINFIADKLGIFGAVRQRAAGKAFKETVAGGGTLAQAEASALRAGRAVPMAVAKDVGIATGAEGFQEGSQQLAQNLFGYNPVGQGVAESAVIGGIIGGGFGGVHSGLAGRAFKEDPNAPAGATPPPPGGAVTTPAGGTVPPPPGGPAAPIDEAATAELQQHAADRLASLDRRAKGTEARTVTGPDGKPMTIPGEDPQLLTVAEVDERNFLRSIADLSPEDQARAIAQSYPGLLDDIQARAAKAAEIERDPATGATTHPDDVAAQQNAQQDATWTDASTGETMPVKVLGNGPTVQGVGFSVVAKPDGTHGLARTDQLKFGPPPGPLTRAGALTATPVSAGEPTATEVARLNASIGEAAAERGEQAKTAEKERVKQEEAIRAADERVELARQKDSEVQRSKLLDDALNDPDVQDPVGKFVADLGRAGYKGEFAVPTAQERTRIESFKKMRAAIDQEQLDAATPAGTPNEMDVAALVPAREGRGLASSATKSGWQAQPTSPALPAELHPAAFAAKALSKKDGPTAWHQAVKRWTKNDQERKELMAAWKAWDPKTPLGESGKTPSAPTGTAPKQSPLATRQPGPAAPATSDGSPPPSGAAPLEQRATPGGPASAGAEGHPAQPSASPPVSPSTEGGAQTRPDSGEPPTTGKESTSQGEPPPAATGGAQGAGTPTQPGPAGAGGTPQTGGKGLEGRASGTPGGAPTVPPEGQSDEERLAAKRAIFQVHKDNGVPDEIAAHSVLKAQETANERGEPMTLWRGGADGGVTGLVPANQKSPLRNGTKVATIYPENAAGKVEPKPQEDDVEVEGADEDGNQPPPVDKAHSGSGVPEPAIGASVTETKEIGESLQPPGGDQMHHLFDKPTERVRAQDKVKVYNAAHGWMTLDEAKKRILEWEEHAVQQGKTTVNHGKVVLSLFDRTGVWSLPWEQAGYTVWRFDIQHSITDEFNGEEINPSDISQWSAELMNDYFGAFEGQDVYAVLAACPCTDFASSGARHFAAKDADGRTASSVALVHQVMATVEYFKPAVWALENPVGRIETLTGMPPWRLSFDPNHYGDPYTKKTLLWGRFNPDLPIAPVEPTEGSKMHAQYGGKSLATKNARSETPEGFAYSFFMANNAVDHRVMAIANKYDRLDKAVIAAALERGVTEEQIDHAVGDPYYMDLDDDAANAAIAALPGTAKPAPAPKPDEKPGEPEVIIFSSGMSRPGDFKAAFAADHSIGIDINELSTKSIPAIAEAMHASPSASLFVDTGAFGLFRAQLRADQRNEKAGDLFEGEADKGPAPLDWQAIFDKFDALGIELSKVSEETGGDLQYRVYWVMPDIVGDQTASLDLLREHRMVVRSYLDTMNPIIPLQVGKLSLTEAYDEAAKILGRGDFIIGIPSNERAASDDQFREFLFLRGDRIGGIHILGAASPKRLGPRMQAIKDSKFHGHVSADANRLRSLMWGDTDRAAAMRKLLGTEERPDNRIMGVSSELQDTETIGGVTYELFRGLESEQAAIRVRDESGGVVSIKQYPSFAAASREFNEAIDKAAAGEKPEKTLEELRAEAAAAEPRADAQKALDAWVEGETVVRQGFNEDGVKFYVAKPEAKPGTVVVEMPRGTRHVFKLPQAAPSTKQPKFAIGEEGLWLTETLKGTEQKRYRVPKKDGSGMTYEYRVVPTSSGMKTPGWKVVGYEGDNVIVSGHEWSDTTKSNEVVERVVPASALARPMATTKAPKPPQTPTVAPDADFDAEARAKAKDDFDAALGDLDAIFGKGFRKNMMPEQEQKLLPVLVRLFDAAFRMGYYEFKRAAKFVMDTLRERLGIEVANEVSIDHLQGAYIGMSGRYPNATKKKDVVAVESKDELGVDDGQTDTGTDGKGPLDNVPPGENGPAEGGGAISGGDPRGGDSGVAGDTPAPVPGVRPPRSGGSGAPAVHPPGTRAGGGRSGRSGKRTGAKGKGVPADDGRNNVVPEAPSVPEQNFRIDEGVRLGVGGEVEKFNDNILAIEVLKDIERENRRATAEEHGILARYVGWGGLSNAFADDEGNFKDGWEVRGKQLADALLPSELKAARRSTRNAHYTSETVVRGMWDIAERLGFKGGLALETSMGTGNFVGLSPDSVEADTNFIGVEFDSITARIAGALYPRSTVLHSPFEKVPVNDDAFDLAIGNPPYGAESLRFQFKPELAGLSIHNQFVIAALDAVRPGGLSVQVVSRYVMDAADSRARGMLAVRGELLGAIRLPDNAFQQNARTQVVTDILVFQRRTPAEQAQMQEAFTASQLPAPKGRDDLAAWNRLVSRLPSWVKTTQIADPLGGEDITVNDYFALRPEMMLGTLERSGSMQGREQVTLRAEKGADLNAELQKAIDNLPRDVVPERENALAIAAERFKSMSDALRIAIAGHENGTITKNKDGKLEQVIERETPEGGFELAKRELKPSSPWSDSLLLDGNGKWYRLVPQLDPAGNVVKVIKDGVVTKRNVYMRETFQNESDIPDGLRLGATKYDRLMSMVGLRDLMVEQLNIETAGDDPTAMEVNRHLMVEAYEAFVREHGFVSENGSVVADMPDEGLIMAYETAYRPAITAARAARIGERPRPASVDRAAILSRRVAYPYDPPSTADSPADALAITLAEVGHVDVVRMAALLGKTPEEVTEELSAADVPLIFLDPESNKWETRDAYLSGQVKRKLGAAQAAGLSKNIAALEAVQPEPWGAENVTALLGSSWVPGRIYADFLTHITGYPAEVLYAPVTNSFAVRATTGSAKGREWSAARMDAADIIAQKLNTRAIAIYDERTDGSGRDLNEEATREANLRAAALENEFQEWLFKDSERRAELVGLFNDRFNTRVNRQHDGSHLILPGKVPDEVIRMRRHQNNVIWRGISERFMLIDHVVGAGKTFTAIARVMERRRMGLSRKPMIVVPNHLIKAWEQAVYQLYPGAKVLAAGQQDFDRKRRRRLFGKIATGDWDIVIMPHSSFTFIGIAKETEERFLQEQLRVAQEAVRDAWEQSGERPAANGRGRKPFNVKEAERLETKILTRMDGLQRSTRDNLLTFEQMGVDDLTIDEAHEFKNLFYSSSLTGVRGMGNKTGSQKAYDLYNKTRVLRESPTGSVVFMTGTPISNSAAEMYTMMRYLAADDLKELGLEHFDAWRAQYVSTNAAWEPTETGRLKEVNRLGRTWTNMRSLMDLYYSFTDAVTNEDIQKWYAEDYPGKKYPIPEVMGGQRQVTVVKPTPAQLAILENVLHRFDHLPYITDPRLRNIERLQAMDMARKVSLDARAADRTSTSKEEGGKLEVIAENVHRIYQKWTPGRGTQLIFLDRSVPKSKGDDKIIKAYDALVAEREAAVAANDEQAFREASDKLEAYDANEIRELRDAQKGGWNAYQQLKDNLVKLGIKPEEIRFIQEANNDAQKQAMFDAVNDGVVRVLIGSTPRMGAGTNVQERIVAIHHADVGWKPAEIEQREGRGIRQGNMLAYDKDGFVRDAKFELEIRTYPVERTIDAKMWSLNSAKLRAINGIRNYNGEFTMDFEDEDSVSMAEIAALASGDPLLLERVKLTSDIQNLEILERAHRSKTWGLMDSIERAERDIKSMPEAIARATAMEIATREATEARDAAKAARTVTVQGVEYRTALEAYRAADEEQAVQQAGDDKAKFAIDVNGRKLRSKEGVTDAINAAMGDRSSFEATIGNTPYFGRTEAGRAIGEMLKARTDKLERGESFHFKAGTMLGFPLEVDVQKALYGENYQVTLSLSDHDGREIASAETSTKSDDYYFGSTSLFHPLSKLNEQISPETFKKAAEKAQHRLQQATAELPGWRSRSGAPFEKADVLAQKRARLLEITQQLSANAPPPQPNVSGGAGAPRSALDKSLIRMVENGATAKGLLTHIAMRTDDPLNRAIAVALMQSGVKPKVRMADINSVPDRKLPKPPDGMTMDEWRSEISAMYDPATDTVLIFKEDETEIDVLHEITHAATYNAIERGGMAARQMQALYDHVLQSGKVDPKKYGLTSLHEFVAEAYGNPDFRSALHAIDGMPGYNESAWDWFVRIVRSILGLQGKAANALAQVLETGRALIKENVHGPMRGAPLPHRAYHGSRHRFPRFDMSKVGTGEGAQSYGQGLYFTSLKDIAEYYRHAGMPDHVIGYEKGTEGDIVTLDMNGQTWYLGRAWTKWGGISMSDGLAWVEDREDAIDFREEAEEDAKAAGKEDDRDWIWERAYDLHTQAMNVEAEKIALPGGEAGHPSVYTVELSPKESEYLDWDRPLKDQTESVKAGIRAAGYGEYLLPATADMTGEALYRQMADDAGYERTGNAKATSREERVIDEKATSDLLHRSGIPGNKYLTGFDRKNKEGDYNYVIFSDEDVTIHEVAQKDSSEFAEWFGDSKVVDEDGKPLVVYHGTTKDFAAFDASKTGSNTRHPSSRFGFWFSADPKVASLFTEVVDRSTWPPKMMGRVGANTMPVYLSIKNPYIMSVKTFRDINAQPYGKDFEEEQPKAAAKFREWIDANKAKLIAAGHDGIKIPGEKAYGDTLAGEEYSADAWVAFEPTQIKSSIGNSGKYSRQNPSIVAQKTSGDPDPVEAKRNEKAVEGKPLLDVARYVANNGSPFEQEVANKVLERLKLLQMGGVKFDFKVAHIGDKVPLSLIGARGITQHKYGKGVADPGITVWVNGTDVTDKVGTGFHTLLHELVHAATMGAIRLGNTVAAKGTKLAQDVADLYDVHRAIVRHFNDRVKNHRADLTEFELAMYRSGNNAFRDPDETVAWALSSKLAQDYLESIPYKGKNLWTSFVTSIRKLLGLPASADTALSEVLRISDALLSDNINELQAMAALTGTSMQVQSAGEKTAAQVSGATPSVTPRGAYAVRGPGGTFATIKDAAINHISDWFTDHSTFTTRKLGMLPDLATSRQKAYVDPANFGVVHRITQQFLSSVSDLSLRAANLAPDVLPQITNLKDVFRGLFNKADRVSKKDLEAVTDALYSGRENRKVWTNIELENQGLTKKQIGLYAQARDAIERSLTDTHVAMLARLLNGKHPEAVKEALENSTPEPILEALNLELAAAVAAAKGQTVAPAESAARAERAAALAELLAITQPANAGTTPSTSADFPEMAAAWARFQAADAAVAKAAKDGAPDPAELRETLKAARQLTRKLKDMMDRGYTPHLRFGNWAVDVVYPNGHRATFSMFDSQKQANAAAREFEQRFPGSEITVTPVSKLAHKVFQTMNPDVVELFGDVLLRRGVLDPKESTVFQEYLKQAMNNQSAMKRFIRDKDVPGYDRDIQRVLASFVTSNARFASTLIHGKRMTAAIDAIDKTRFGQSRDEAQKLADYIREPKEEFSRFRAYLFVNYLGASVASALTNMTQPMMSTFPRLHQYGGKAAMKWMTYASKIAGRRVFGSKDLPADLKTLIERGEREGLLQPQEMHQLYAEAIRGFGSSLTMRKFMQAMGSFFAVSEQFNRELTFIAAVKMSQGWSAAKFAEVSAEAGKPIKNSYDFAKMVVEDTQFIYTKDNRPNWARGVAAPIFTFKMFTIQMLELYKRLPPAQRAIALGLLILMAGIEGFPFADDLDDLIDTLGQTLGYDTNSKQFKRAVLTNVFGKPFANFVLHGVSSFTPLDVSQRLGMGNLIPGTGMFKKSNTDKTDDMLEALGVVGSLAKSMTQAFEALQDGEILKATRLMAPTAVQNVVKGAEIASTGEYRDQRGRKVINAGLTDAAIKGIGFQPADVAEESRLNREVNQNISLVKNKQAEITGKLVRAILDNEPELRQEAMKELFDWNTRNPESRINIRASSVMVAVRHAQMERAQRNIRKAAPSIRGGITDELRG